MDHPKAVRLGKELLERYGLPDIEYVVPGAKESRLADGGLPLLAMLQELQERSRDGATDWLSLEQSIDRLAELLTEPGEDAVVDADACWLELGTIDLHCELVTIQRGDHLVAALAKRADGRLKVASFRPLDGRSANYLVGLGHPPHPESGVVMRENNWEYALDCSASIGNAYGAARGESYLSYWEKGLGLSSDGTEIPEWRAQINLVARPGPRVATEIKAWMAHPSCGM